VDDRVENCKYCNALLKPETTVPPIVVTSSTTGAAQGTKRGCGIGSAIALVAILGLVAGVGGILWAVLSTTSTVSDSIKAATEAATPNPPAPELGPSVPKTTAPPKPPLAKLVLSGAFSANMALSINPEGCATASTTELNMPFADGANVTKVRLLLLPHKPGPGTFTATTGPALISVERLEGGTIKKWQTGAGAAGGIITRAPNGSVKAVFGALQPVAETGATGQLNGIAETVCP
jgi:hypothetical protein